jgi:threonylcarbamoyladenosine tRNA methylthiotransferase MtaB
MGRRYTAAFFRDLMARISMALPQAFIGADVIAGFPGESEEEFDETLQLIEELPFSDLHVFPYSSRPGTRAAAMSGQVPGSVIKKRAELLRNIATDKKKEFLARQTGRKLQVLVQGFNKISSICNGISRNYVTVTFPGKNEMINSEQVVIVAAVEGEHLLATRIAPHSPEQYPLL